MSQLVCALYNGDLDQTDAGLWRLEPDRILSGLRKLRQDETEVILYFPEKEEQLAASVYEKAEKEIADITCACGFVSPFMHREDRIVSLSDAYLAGDDDCADVFLTLPGQELKKYDAELKLVDLIPEMKNLKAVRVGTQFFGPDDRNRTLRELDVKLGTVEYITEKRCVACYMKERLQQYREKSCGHCAFCREGLFQIEEIICDMTGKKSREDDGKLMAEIASIMKESVNCSLGKSAAEMVLALSGLFSSEIVMHLKKKSCPSGECSAFISEHVYVDPAICRGNGDCMDVCPEDCIEGKKGYISVIDADMCTACGKCMDVCEENAIRKTAGKVPKLPSRLVKVGKFRGR
ncbi:MAG: NADH-ubiquinone oxidoreductase-F iron-sulfur binding region domain-containing protein [Lachnospiraceae bacterium]